MASGGLKTVTLGGWYQRTTLHFSEVHALLRDGSSKLPLNQKKLLKLHEGLRLANVERVADFFDVLYAETTDGIRIRYYEDGLYILETDGDNIQQSEAKIRDYFETKWKPAQAYIFSLGAPTPKVLANIEDTHPVAITVITDRPGSYRPGASVGEVYQKMSSLDKSVTVHKTDSHIVVAAKPSAAEMVKHVLEQQIFFREFKDQLGKYLFIHRTLWEEIAEIKERKELTQKELASIRNQLESYRVTIDLIANRLSQMGSFAKTRASIAGRMQVEEHLNVLFEYRFEVLTDTQNYMQEIWVMTKHYLDSTIQVVTELQAKATTDGIKSLRTITLIGVTATIVKFFVDSEGYVDHIFTLKLSGGLGFLMFMLIALALDQILQGMAGQKKHKIKLPARSENL